MNDEKLLQLIAVSNPVPIAASLHPEPGDETPLLLAIYQRSGIMAQTHETTPKAIQQTEKPITLGQPAAKPQPKKVTRRWRPAAAAAAVVIVAAAGVGAWLAASSDNETDVADQPVPTATTPLDSAEGLHTAFNQGDFDAYQAVFAPDAFAASEFGWEFLDQLHAGPVPTVAPDSFGLRLEAECTEDNATLVRCTWVQRGGVFERVGIEMTADTPLFFDEQGVIINQDMAGTSSIRPVGDFFATFGSWLRATHPDVFEATYTTLPELPQPLSNDAIDTLESRAQWAAVLDEFLAQSDTYPLAG